MNAKKAQQKNEERVDGDRKNRQHYAKKEILIFYRNEEKNMGFRSLNLNIRSSVVHYTGRKTYKLSKVHKKSTVLRYIEV